MIFNDNRHMIRIFLGNVLKQSIANMVAMSHDRLLLEVIHHGGLAGLWVPLCWYLECPQALKQYDSSQEADRRQSRGSRRLALVLRVTTHSLASATSHCHLLAGRMVSQKCTFILVLLDMARHGRTKAVSRLVAVAHSGV